MKRIVVLGGSGFLGGSVCERLQRRCIDGSIVVPTRRLRSARHLLVLPTVELTRADVHDDTALARVIKDADAVINLIAVLHGDKKRFDKVHVELPRRLGAACRAAGVRRLVHVSALGVGPKAPSNYLRSKTAGEAALTEAGLDLTLLRPSLMFGVADRFTNLFAGMQSFLPVVPLAAAQAQFQPVWVEDVAHAIVTALDRRDTIGEVYECVGPTRLTLAEIVRLSGRLAGHERPIMPLPDVVARLQAMLMALLPGDPLMSADNLDSMKVPSVASGIWPGLEALGITPSALEAVASTYLGQTAQAARLIHWRAKASG